MPTVRSEPSHRGWRLDRYLAARFPEHSRVRLQELIRAGKVTIADRRADEPARRLAGGETITIELPERRAAASLQATAMPLAVVYEDEAMAVIEKPAGLIVHPGAGTREPTLVEGLLARFGNLAAGFVGGPPRPGLVHRLDRGTSGLLVVAKTDVAHRALARQFAHREVEKYYLALVYGVLARSRGEITGAIGRDPRRRTRMATRRLGGREARTGYAVEATFADERARGERWRRLSLLRVRLFTGRTHQIRVHLSALGHAIVGDRMYGAPAGELERTFLHAAELRFRHPLSGEPVALRSPLPAELKAFLGRLRRL